MGCRRNGGTVIRCLGIYRGNVAVRFCSFGVDGSILLCLWRSARGRRRFGIGHAGSVAFLSTFIAPMQKDKRKEEDAQSGCEKANHSRQGFIIPAMSARSFLFDAVLSLSGVLGFHPLFVFSFALLFAFVGRIADFEQASKRAAPTSEPHSEAHVFISCPMYLRLI